MNDDTTKPGRRTTFALRVTEAERAKIDALSERAAYAYLPPGGKMTDRLLLMIALDRLEAHLNKLDRGKARRDAEKEG